MSTGGDDRDSENEDPGLGGADGSEEGGWAGSGMMGGWWMAVVVGR